MGFQLPAEPTSIPSTSNCVDDLLQFVAHKLRKEGANPSSEDMLELMNDAVQQIFDNTDIILKTWNLTVTDFTAQIPSDLKRIESLEANGYALEQTSRQYMDLCCSTWDSERSGSASVYMVSGSTIEFNGVPDAPVTIVGYAAPEDLTLGTMTDDPLGYIPKMYQKLPAYYALAMTHASPDNAVEIARQQQYLALWQQELPNCIYSIKMRGSQIMA